MSENKTLSPLAACKEAIERVAVNLMEVSLGTPLGDVMSPINPQLADKVLAVPSGLLNQVRLLRRVAVELDRLARLEKVPTDVQADAPEPKEEPEPPAKAPPKPKLRVKKNGDGSPPN